MNAQVDEYIHRSKKWPEEMTLLRPILLGCGLTEAIKWRKPCYSHEGKNIAILQEMKSFLALMFFKGALLEDTRGLLEEQGPNSRSARRMTFTSTQDVTRQAAAVKAFVRQAIEAELVGLNVPPAPELQLVEELRERLERDPKLAAAFQALTPGRRREYHLHVSSAKQAATRAARVEKCVPKILRGKGFRDR